ncbi:LacI family DNA-binding transcriptional regulator [Paenibacillus daejeonensis]|uniref:LacI family DNA-binding transcriptional regulator n=1 Tax=Paenibacillus daejeonensis TaxID=135193 RepID=UPI000373449E|nr:LacI family DNA-binding transcriptional regulator [Paenibacillus daejeonensis]
MPMPKKVTLHHLAAELGLSAHTVSKALRGLPGMSEDTRHRVQELAMRRGYRTKEQENSMLFERTPLYANRSRRFLFLLPSQIGLNSALHQALLESVQHRLTDAGHKVELLFVPEELDGAAGWEPWAAKHELVYADGLFLSPNLKEAVERRLIELPVPAVMLNFPPVGANLDSVIWNIADSMQQCIRLLVQSGHQRIMYIGPTDTVRGFTVRWHSYLTALEAAGLQAEPEHCMLELDGEAEDWQRRWLEKVERMRPTAFVCATQHAVVRLYTACGATGQRIPDDYSLVALEPEPALHGLMPDLARPLLPVQATGYRAVERMLWRIANPAAPFESILLQGDLHAGATVNRL